MSMLLTGVGVSSPSIAAYPVIAGTLAMFVDTDPIYTDTGATVPATAQGDPVAAWEDPRTGKLLVQSTLADRFGLRLDSANGRRSTAYGYLNNNGGGFAWPSGVSVNARDCTIWAVVRQTEVYFDFCAFNPGANLTDLLVDSTVLTSARPNSFRLFGTGANSGASTIPAYSDECLIVIKCEGAHATLYRNEDSFVSTNPFAAGTLTGGSILARQDGYPLRAERFACGIIDHAVTSDELVALQTWAYTRYRRAAVTKQLVTRGDSRTVGHGTTLGKNWPCVAIDTQMPAGWRLWNQGLDATDCQTSAGNITVSGTALFDGGLTKNVFAQFEGINDLGVNSRTGAQLIADVSTILTAMKGAGFSTVVCTEPSVTGYSGWDVTRETHRVTYNTALRTGGALASLVDVLVDLDLDSLIGDPANLTYRDADHLHYTQAGTNRLAVLISAGVLAA